MTMRRLRKQRVRPRLFVVVLVLGPLNAQTVFACMMMGGIEFDTCCCDDHAPAILDSDDGDESCCETSVELRIEQSSEQKNPITKPVEVRSDVDPPPAILVAHTIDPRPERAFTTAYRTRIWLSHNPGSQTYLTTLRLRI